MSGYDPKRTLQSHRCSAIYVNSAESWIFLSGGENSRAMAQFKVNSPGFLARRDMARQLIGVALLYLGIFAIFAAVTLIISTMWLFIW
jgi:hypothetical protein